MRGSSLRRALWHSHINALSAPPALRHWLTGAGSLTAKLKAHSRVFRVHKLHQHIGVCLADEAAAIGLPRPRQVHERDVLLKTDGLAVVFAHTVVPLAASAADWPQFGGLGERSLGSTLFGDPHVQRGPLAYAKLGRGHPLVRRAAAALGMAGFSAQYVYARRCIYRRHRGVLLVTELFLPEIATLVAAPLDNIDHNTIKEANKQ